MTDLRKAAKEALWAFQYHVEQTWPTDRSTVAIAALRAALAQQEKPVEEHKHWCASLTQLLLSDPPKRAPCDCKKKQDEPVQEPVQEPVAWYRKRGQEVLTSHPACWGREDEPWTPLYAAPPQRKPQTLDDTLTLPRAMAQAYENGYNAGVAHEREECAQVCEARFVGDLTREDMEARRCAAAIRARGVQS